MLYENNNIKWFAKLLSFLLFMIDNAIELQFKFCMFDCMIGNDKPLLTNL